MQNKIFVKTPQLPFFKIKKTPTRRPGLMKQPMCISAFFLDVEPPTPSRLFSCLILHTEHAEDLPEVGRISSSRVPSVCHGLLPDKWVLDRAEPGSDPAAAPVDGDVIVAVGGPLCQLVLLEGAGLVMDEQAGAGGGGGQEDEARVAGTTRRGRRMDALAWLHSLGT